MQMTQLAPPRAAAPTAPSAPAAAAVPAALTLVAAGCARADAGPPPAGASVVAGATVESFSTTYTGWNARLNRTRSFAIEGRRPAAAGTYPVLVYTVGTFQSYDAVEALAWIDAAAAAGYVAATVEYSNGTYFSCPAIEEKAASLYDDTYSPNNALAVLCADEKADCDRGIVTVGLSQGSWMAALAYEHDPRVRATLGLGMGLDARLWGGDHTDCLVTNRGLPVDRLRIVNGESDDAWGTRNDMIAQIDTITASSCGADAMNCLRPDGTGWLLVRDEDIVDGLANHAYMSRDGGGVRLVDENWAGSAGEWTLSGGLDWLSAYVELP